MQPASLIVIKDIYIVDQLIILMFSHMFQKLREGLYRYYWAPCLRIPKISPYWGWMKAFWDHIHSVSKKTHNSEENPQPKSGSRESETEAVLRVGLLQEFLENDQYRGKLALVLGEMNQVPKKQKVFFRSLFKIQYCGEPPWPRSRCSASDRQGPNFESFVWRAVSSHSSQHPQEVLLVQFSLYVHKGGLKPDSFNFFDEILNLHE